MRDRADAGAVVCLHSALVVMKVKGIDIWLVLQARGAESAFNRAL
jgi:hypothetical protein